MSGIKKRTIFINKGIDGFFRQSDWSKVVTNIGTMYMPDSVNQKLALNDANGFEASDMMARIDEVAGYDPGAQIFGDDGSIGGGLNPVHNY